MIGWLVVAAAGAAELSDDLTEAWAASRQSPAWRSPTRPEREAVQQGVQLLAEAAITCDPAGRQRAAEGLASAGLGVRELSETVWLVAETDEHYGAGFLALRCGAGASVTSVTLQAPHGRYDLGTGELLVALFATSTARAAQWNTVHRYRAVPGERPADPVHPADVAHQPGSLFHAATLGLAAADPQLRVVQLHGFAKGRVEAELVLSSGDASRPPEAAGLAAAGVGGVALFGRDVQTLGGTTNAQARALPGRFLHVEMSADLRERLATSDEQLAALWTAVAGPWW